MAVDNTTRMLIYTILINVFFFYSQIHIYQWRLDLTYFFFYASNINTQIIILKENNFLTIHTHSDKTYETALYLRVGDPEIISKILTQAYLIKRVC